MKYLIIIIVIIVAVLLMNNVNSCQCSVANDKVDIVMKQADNSRNIKKNKTLILYWATWCHHCEVFMTTWNELKKKYDGKIIFIDVEHKQMYETELAKIKGFPAIFYIDENGKEQKIKDRNNIPKEIGL